ncbi:MAG: hypothetical protein A3F72_04730 [Bacteroidetes bacterium RIFCSPLOWO2_12_FULL_35_15]|nr:MAG: hypothetical protein A3F72_04730 [Bacteroidetes bacterium RIFCSPLOWO2_12_FULL_35_15]
MSSNTRPYVLTIAGFDPSAGAGILADIKTFEANKVYGLGVPSALTFQNDIEFNQVEWISLDKIISQIALLQKRFQIEYIKIGLIENLEVLFQLISYFKTLPESKIQNPKFIWDPILKASAGYEFHKDVNKELVQTICKEIYLITPNIPEALILGTADDALKNAEQLQQFCNVYLKGGHAIDNKGKDYLFTNEGKLFSFKPKTKEVFQKHGSGCVLSSAITANLAKGIKIHPACLRAKEYTSNFLGSNKSLLGYHKL